MVGMITGILLISLVSLSSALIINSVSMDHDTIAPGEKSSVTFSVKNNGDNDLTDVSISLDFTNIPLAPYDSSSEYTINQLDSDKTKEVSFQILAFNNAASGIYKIPVNIKYNEDGIIANRQSIISIMVNSIPIIDINYDDGLLLKGQNNKVTIKIINKGLADVKFLELNAESSSSYNIISQSQVYIGDVDSNDFQTADFSIYFNNNPSKLVSLPLNVKYKDVTNKEYTQNFDIQLKVYTKEQAQSLGLVSADNTIYIVLGIIVLIVVFFIYRAIRKRRRQNEIQ